MKKILVIFGLLLGASVVSQAQYDFIGLTGSATSVGWNITSPIALQQDSGNPAIFTWSGNLSEGELKFPTFTGDWCDGPWLNAATPNQSISNEAYIITNGCDGPDNKWVVQLSEAGFYNVIVDLTNATITFQQDQTTVPQYNDLVQDLTTDKALYSPGSIVNFEMNLSNDFTEGLVEVNYYYLGKVIHTDNFNSNTQNITWQWTTPDLDFNGYLAEVKVFSNETLLGQAAIAMDVSSHWSKFPRYGFLSKYGNISNAEISNVINNLNRHHINGIQFYDWLNKHHLPLPGAPDNPQTTWQDIAGNTVSLNTVNEYILQAHSKGMKAMAYDLAFGAWENASADGVSEEWYIFKDGNLTEKDKHDLPDSWLSDSYLLDPANKAWQEYLVGKMNDAFEVLDFDGFHIDQLGDRGPRYDYERNKIFLKDRYLSFINYCDNHLNGEFVFNSVDQYAQDNLAKGNVQFLYTETWSTQTYNDLRYVILQNNEFGNDQLNTVLAAYMNYDRASQGPGFFNTNSVLMTNALIFSSGGSHLELGEHMLGTEYFLNDNLKMDDRLVNALVNYYDFLVAYENLLRDGGEFSNNNLSSTTASVQAFPAGLGAVGFINKNVGSREIFHLLNYDGASSLEWRDNSASQTKPKTKYNLALSFNSSNRIKKLWMASPDTLNGIPIPLDFNQDINGQVTFTMPYLSYWTMIVADKAPRLGFTPSKIEGDDVNIEIQFEDFEGEGSTIYYTFDENLPADNISGWIAYSGPIFLDKSDTLRAIYLDPDSNISEVFEQPYNFETIRIKVIKPASWGQINLHIQGVAPVGSSQPTFFPGLILESSRSESNTFVFEFLPEVETAFVIFSDNGKNTLERIEITESQTIDLNDFIPDKPLSVEPDPYFKIYPNPFNGYLKIETSKNGYLISDIQLLDQEGKTVYKAQIINEEWLIDSNNLPPGLYFFRANTNHGFFQFKVVKE